MKMPCHLLDILLIGQKMNSEGMEKSQENGESKEEREERGEHLTFPEREIKSYVLCFFVDS